MEESQPVLLSGNKKSPHLYRVKNVLLIFACVSLLVLIIILSITYSTSSDENDMPLENTNQIPLQRKQCQLTIVESIPVNLTFSKGSPQHLSTFNAWKILLNSATKYINIASFYWSLRSSHQDPTGNEGIDIFNQLLEAGTKRNISIRIVQDVASSAAPNSDTKFLQEKGAAIVRTLNMTRLLGNGIIHTKLFMVDGAHFYVGSANMDWRSLTQVKELGVLVNNCTKVAQDMQKIFDIYWEMAKDNAIVPKRWPKTLETKYNDKNPMPVKFNATLDSLVYLSSSPAKFCPSGRTVDIDAILSVIDNAHEFVHIAVMEYAPLIFYSNPLEFWPVIDDKLRQVAAIKKIKVKLLISKWGHTRAISVQFLKSLAILNSKQISVEVKLFKVPCVTPAQCSIPFARVNHNKYMVTDQEAYIGTSNWSGNYFVKTAGIGFVLKSGINGTDSKIREQLADVFNRDWNSNHAEYLVSTNFTHNF